MSLHRIVSPLSEDAKVGNPPVYLIGGVGFTDRPGVIEYCLSAGYHVEPAESVPSVYSAAVEAYSKTPAARRIGTPLRDAAVDPRPGDYLAPTNAGKPGPQGNPHSGHVVSLQAASPASGRTPETKPTEKNQEIGA